MSSIYGAEHLLRMLGTRATVTFSNATSNNVRWYRIVSMPTMVASSSMDPESVGLVRDYVNELLA